MPTKTTNEPSYDVIVVGAGLSGLVCAQRLQAAGKRVLVVEARDRVGGRTLSQPLGRATFDLGGQWLGPGQHRVQRLADALGVETFPTYAHGRHVFCGRNRTTTYRGTIPRISPFGLAALGIAIARVELLTRRVSATEPWTARDAAELDRRSAAELTAGMGGEGRAAFDAAVRTIFGAEAADLSLLHFAWYTRAGEGFFSLVDVEGGAQERRFVRGAQALSLELRDRLPGDAVVLGAPVTAVEQGPDHVRVVADKRAFTAARLVMALPPPQLASIEFTPALPERRRRANDAAKMGSAIKVHALYPRAFWRAAGLSGEAVFEEGPLSVMFDNTSVDGAQPALVGFIVGENAEIWRHAAPDDRRRAVLDNLRRAFGVEALAPAHYVEHDWCAEAFSGGCPAVGFPPGTFAEASGALREPCGRIHWAGTETATHYPGYLEGAIEAGERAARECIEC